MENNNSPKRYIEDKNVYSWHYIHDHELVKCPRCDTAGKVKNAEFYCSHCHLHLQDGKSFHWYSDVLYTTQRHDTCYHCGSSLSYRKVVPTNYGDVLKENISKTVVIACTQCQRQNTVVLQKVKICNHEGEDYYFGLPLLLQIPCSQGILWAYNWQHLQALKAFIQADLRERTKKSGNGSLMSRLPLWIKSAKNREMLLKMIGKMEKIHQNLGKN